jgi:tetratricopeptide (TPR) repeat protein
VPAFKKRNRTFTFSAKVTKETPLLGKGMGCKKSKQSSTIASSEATDRKPTTLNSDSSVTFQRDLTDSIRQPRIRIIQSFIVIWLDPNINESNADYQNSLVHIRRIVNSINTFANIDSCVQFLNGIRDEKVFMIVSDHVCRQIVPRIQQMDQILSIYVFSNQTEEHELKANEWSKVKGVFTQIESICDSLKQDFKQCYKDMISISTFSSTDASDPHFDRLDQSFMYSQLIKEILLTIVQDDDTARKQFAQLCRDQYSSKDLSRSKIDDFERDYHLHTPVWWYTKEQFIYEMINRALRTQETEIIIKMGFFMQDLHQQIKRLHTGAACNKKPTDIYRGQGMFHDDFEKMRKNKGGLLSFNSFLSTSTDDKLAFARAESAKDDPNLIGIFFKMKVDAEHSSTPFASVVESSYYQDTEQEFLFSMHSVFRIGDIKQEQARLWKVELTLTRDTDQQLMCLTDYIRKEIKGTIGWHRLGKLLIKLGKLDYAEKVYKSLLDSAPNYNSEEEEAYIQHQLGNIHREKGLYKSALSFYEKALDIRNKEVANTNENIGLTYQYNGEYSNALSFHLETLRIREKCISLDDPAIASSYNNIGGVYNDIGDYSRALSFFQKTLEIDQKTLPPNHPDLATTYNNIGASHRRLGDLHSALVSYEKALEIQKHSLPPDHPELAATLYNIGLIRRQRGDYSIALSFYEQALEIRQKSLSPNCPDVAIVYNNIGLVYKDLKEYDKALSFHHKALEIQQKYLHPHHRALATTYNNIGLIHHDMKNYPEALLFYQKACQIDEKSLPSDDSEVAFTYVSIGGVYRDMEEYLKALSFYQRALEMQEKSDHANQPTMAIIYNSLATAHEGLNEFDVAVRYGEQAVDIAWRAYGTRHPQYQIFRNNLDRMRKKLTTILT